MGAKDKKGGKNNKKGPAKPLTKDDMIRMGFPPEEIERILGQQNMSAEDQAKQKEEDEAKAKAKAKATQDAKFKKMFDDLLEEETNARRLNLDNMIVLDFEELQKTEQDELAPIKKKWEIEMDRERKHKEAAENRKRRENAKAEFMAYLEAMTPEERQQYEELSAEQQELEQEAAQKRFEAELAAKLEKEEKEKKEAEKKEKAAMRAEAQRQFREEMLAKGIDITAGGDKKEADGHKDKASAKEDAFLSKHGM